jgi:hypothetical protein
MPKAKTKPKVKYVQVATPDMTAVDDVFNYLFDKFLKQSNPKSEQKDTQERRQS